MGSHWSLKIDSFTALTGRSYLDPWIAALFAPGELRTGREAYGDHPDEVSDFCRYEVEASTIAARLDLMGFTLQRARADFEVQSAADAEERAAFRAYYEPFSPLEFDAWSGAFCAIVTRRLCPYFDALPDDVIGGPVEAVLQGIRQDGGPILAFPTTHLYFCIRAALAAVASDTPVILDISEVVSNGYVEAAADHRQDALDAFAWEYGRTARVVVLTEGATDARVLELALRLRRPHLEQHFAFLDFGATAIAGGVGALVHNVKALAAAGIPNRVVAMFDNDTAGRVGMSSLSKLRLPANFVATLLPDIELGRSYPCVGPDGVGPQNINGRACSVELYCGTDVLADGQGGYFPIRWGGFDAGLGEYQGEIQNKRLIHERFQAKAAEAMAQPGAVNSAAWKEMDALLEHLLAVCSSIDPSHPVGVHA